MIPFKGPTQGSHTSQNYGLKQGVKEFLEFQKENFDKNVDNLLKL